jgi:hypothetical protein
MPLAPDFQRELDSWFQQATNQGQPHIDINSGDLHDAAGGKPGKDNRQATCCGVMYINLVCRHGDEIIGLPKGGSGLGRHLIIRYVLPRPGAARGGGGGGVSGAGTNKGKSGKSD